MGKADNGIVHIIDGVMMIPQGDLVDVLAADDRFSTLVTAVKEAGLVDTVKAADAFTIFAPTNEAFAKVPEDALNSLLADKEALTDVLLRCKNRILVLKGNYVGRIGDCRRREDCKPGVQEGSCEGSFQ